MPKALDDLIGKIFGRWTVHNRSSVCKGRSTVWDCVCSCGTKKPIRAYTLKNGNSKSCGCLSSELAHKRRFIDLTGQVFGRLFVVEYLFNDKNGKPIWKCKCICGGESTAIGTDLRNGHTQSCGCINIENRLRCGSDHPNYGKKATEETKTKMSISRTGFRHSKESKRKMSIIQTGENHPNWKGGLTPAYRRIRNLSKYKQWRIDVFTRDNYTCQLCNQNGGTLNAHHVQSFAEAIEYRFNVDNGKTLCESCHMNLHREVA